MANQPGPNLNLTLDANGALRPAEEPAESM